MTDFVNDGGAQNYREFELGVIYLGEAQCGLVIDTCKDGMDNKTENCILEFINHGRRKYSQPNVRDLDWSVTRLLCINGALPRGALQPHYTQPCPAEYSISLPFGPCQISS